MHRHLCRCGAHARILKAIEAAAARLRAEGRP
jgi:nicotinate dehydrogenase subunit A